VPCKSALIIVDVQNDFITGTLANQFQAEAIVPVINGMRDAFDLTVISLDWCANPNPNPNQNPDPNPAPHPTPHPKPNPQPYPQPYPQP
jgi:nicotinamidase-related amidase